MVLGVAGVLRQKHFRTAAAFLERSDVADDLIYPHRISEFVKPPNGDAFFALFHKR
jgi:hypothetical protein